MVESIKELKKICRKTGSNYTNKISLQPFFYIKFLRFFSIYFVKLGILLHMTPNQMTFVSMLTIILAGFLFSLANPFYWIPGCILLILFSMLDCADGELARYYKKSSPIGRYFDLWVHGVESSVTFTGITFGLYAITQQPIVFLLGFITVISFLLNSYSTALKRWHLFEYALKMKDESIVSKPEIPRDKRVLFTSYYNFKQYFSFFSIPYIILIAVILDIIFKPLILNIFSISILVNWRLMFLLFFTLLAPVMLIKGIKNTLKLNAKLKSTKVNQ